MTAIAPAATVVSAPGKVLLAGGYLALDRNYTGLVLGLNARIHVHIRSLPIVIPPKIIVRSPQFIDAEWSYGYQQAEDGGGVQVSQCQGSISSQSRNHFVETALAYALTYVSAVTTAKPGPVLVTILADGDYYSHSATPSDNSEAAVSGHFRRFGLSLPHAHKTGLGSSAALVTALTAALLSHYLPSAVISIGDDSGRFRLHNLAQAAHCTAQGKVGSGFDVAAAVYGSCVYKRFSPSVLNGLRDVGTRMFADHLKSVVEGTDSLQKWDTVVDKSKATIPRGLRLVMCDVDCGSETVAMVKTVLEWRKSNPEVAELLWGALQNGNEELAGELRRLGEGSNRMPPDYENLRAIILTIRSLMREMSTKAGVPIEPLAQTKLIDACCTVPGVIGGVCPGAGGFDAIALIVKDTQDTLLQLQSLLDRYTLVTAEGAGASIRKVSLLGVKQEFEGVRFENSIIYEGWVT